MTTGRIFDIKRFAVHDGPGIHALVSFRAISKFVRVAGYSDYFCDLSKALQNEIITRTEHESF